MPSAKRPTRKNSKSAQPNLNLSRAQRILRARLPELRETYSVKSLGIFGSYVRGEQKKRSDLDILIEFEQAPTLFEYVRLQRHLSEMVGVQVDLVMKKTLKPNIGQHILAEVVAIV